MTKSGITGIHLNMENFKQFSKVFARIYIPSSVYENSSYSIFLQMWYCHFKSFLDILMKIYWYFNMILRLISLVANNIEFFVLFLAFHKSHGNSGFFFYEVIVMVFGQCYWTPSLIICRSSYILFV